MRFCRIDRKGNGEGGEKIARFGKVFTSGISGFCIPENRKRHEDGGEGRLPL
jgi:hypothetical protein